MSALHKVLVVDDDPVVGTSFNRVLSAKGYQVITAHDAAEALERLRQEEVDLVYTDIRMPGMDGLELAEQVRTRRPWTPVVIVTGYGTTADEERAHAAGVTAFLHKPLSPEMIEGSAVDALQHTGAPTAAAVAPIAPIPPIAPIAPPASAAEPHGTRLRDVALFFAAPFIGLVYAVFLPFVGIGLLAWMGVRELVRAGALRKVGRTLKFVGLVLTTPFIGLAYAVLLPVVGLAALVWVALRSPREPTAN